MIVTPSGSARLKSDADPARVEQLSQRDTSRRNRAVDRIFLWVLLLEWAFAVALAALVSPAALNGRAHPLHVGVGLAFLLGGAVNALPLWLIYRRPGSFLTQCVLSVAQGLWSGLLIHLSGGRIETHFHVFGSLALLSFYRDWRVLLPATAVVIADHFFRGLYLPDSIYGQFDVERWRFLEHAAWILFEDVFLIMACVRATRSTRVSAWREAKWETATALLEEANALIEKKVAERTAELETAQAQYKAVLEASNTVPWEFDFAAGGIFTYIAPQVERICGWPAARFAEPGFLLSCVHPEDRKALRDAFSSAAVDADGTIEYRFRCKDQRWATVLAQFRRVPDPKGRHVFRGVSVDLTKQRALELELRQAQKLESVGRLAAGVAHEINTPVQFVSDSVHFLQDAVRDLVPLHGKYRELGDAVLAGSATAEMASALAEQRESADLPYLLENIPRALTRSLDGLGRVATIVRSMKEFAHPDQKEMVSVDLNRAIESTLTIARHEYKLVADVETRLGTIPEVLCYAGEINQVLLNILVNAAHAIEEVVRGTEKRGVIRIETAQEGEAVVVSISDTGGGIPPAIRERIFDPFFTTKEVGKGTGQGLAIARAVVQEKHGGRLTFTSELGLGTTFTIRLPLDGKRAAQGPAEPALRSSS